MWKQRHTTEHNMRDGISLLKQSFAPSMKSSADCANVLGDKKRGWKWVFFSFCFSCSERRESTKWEPSVCCRRILVDFWCWVRVMYTSTGVMCLRGRAREFLLTLPLWWHFYHTKTWQQCVLQLSGSDECENYFPPFSLVFVMLGLCVVCGVTRHWIPQNSNAWSEVFTRCCFELENFIYFSAEQSENIIDMCWEVFTENRKTLLHCVVERVSSSCRTIFILLLPWEKQELTGDFECTRVEFRFGGGATELELWELKRREMVGKVCSVLKIEWKSSEW